MRKVLKLTIILGAIAGCTLSVLVNDLRKVAGQPVDAVSNSK